MEIPLNEANAAVFCGTAVGGRQVERRHSGTEIGAANVQRPRSYLDQLAATGSKLPSRKRQGEYLNSCFRMWL
ncbi:MAG TPA: hypothetical protein VG206_10260 [Terriglobia bacterium]|nr:hypothetical protein [Terriglobia bacterium]